MKGHCNATFYYACEYINVVHVLYSTFIVLHSFKVNTLYIYRRSSIYNSAYAYVSTTYNVYDKARLLYIYNV